MRCGGHVDELASTECPLITNSQDDTSGALGHLTLPGAWGPLVAVFYPSPNAECHIEGTGVGATLRLCASGGCTENRCGHRLGPPSNL